MSKKNVAQETQKRIAEMQEKKATELKEIDNKITELMEKKNSLADIMEIATEKMDLQNYKKADQELKEVKTAIDMYNGKYKQISAQRYISESESDRVIDNLLAYEKQLEQDFIADLKEPICTLREILKNYFDSIQETEQTIRTWETQIHANYSTRGLTFRTDAETGKRTDRSATPVLVHNTPFKGCNTALALSEYLNKAPFKKI